MKLPAWIVVLIYLTCWPAAVLANHDERDPDGICLAHAKIASEVWALQLRDVYNMPLEKVVPLVTPDVSKASEKMAKLTLLHTKKGLDLVWGEKLPAEQVYEKFYEWCLGTLPKPEPEGTGT